MNKSEKINALLNGLAAAATLVWMFSGFSEMHLESKLLAGHARPMPGFAVPIHMKGVVRYGTSHDARLHSLCNYGLLGSAIVGGPAIVFLAWQRRRERKVAK